MTAVPDPTSGITIAGGGTFSRVETEEIVAQATTLRQASDDAAAACGRVLTAVLLIDGASRDARMLGIAPGLVGTGFAGTEVLVQTLFPAGWPAHVRAARDEARSLVVATFEELRDLVTVLDDIADRMLKAAGLYVQGESTTQRVLQEVAGVPVVGLGVTSAVGVLAFGRGILEGEGLPWGYLVTKTSGMQEPALSAAGSALGRLDVDRDRTKEPTIANGSSVLRGLAEGYRGFFRDRVQVTEVKVEDLPDAVDLPVPETAEDLLRGIDAVHGAASPLPPSVVAVEQFARDDGTSAWVVTIPGTELMSSGSPFGMTSNFDLVQGELSDSADLVLEAMGRAGISATDEVALVGHSQGGAVAVLLAGATAAGGSAPRYTVTNVLTAGAPVGSVPLPPGVRGIHTEIEQEGVSNLDGGPNVATADQVTVHKDLDHTEDPDDPAARTIPHAVPHHVQVLNDARRIGNPGLEANIEALEGLIDGERVGVRYFRGQLALDPGAVARRLAPTSPMGPLADRVWGDVS